jgi:hypothetical protein
LATFRKIKPGTLLENSNCGDITYESQPFSGNPASENFICSHDDVNIFLKNVYYV